MSKDMIQQLLTRLDSLEGQILPALEAMEKRISSLEKKRGKQRPNNTEQVLVVHKLLSDFFNLEGDGAFIESSLALLDWAGNNPVVGFSGIHKEGAHVLWGRGESMQYRVFDRIFIDLIELRKGRNDKTYVELTF